MTTSTIFKTLTLIFILELTSKSPRYIVTGDILQVLTAPNNETELWSHSVFEEVFFENILNRRSFSSIVLLFASKLCLFPRKTILSIFSHLHSNGGDFIFLCSFIRISNRKICACEKTKMLFHFFPLACLSKFFNQHIHPNNDRIKNYH